MRAGCSRRRSSRSPASSCSRCASASTRPDDRRRSPASSSTRCSSFDKPFNQAPSLHIALLVILWVLYARHVPRWLRAGCCIAWFAADRRFGADHLPASLHRHPDRRAARLPLPVGCGPIAEPRPSGRSSGSRATGAAWRWRSAIAASAGVARCHGSRRRAAAALWLLWPAVSLPRGRVVLRRRSGPAGFQKDADGRMTLRRALAARALPRSAPSSTRGCGRATCPCAGRRSPTGVCARPRSRRAAERRRASPAIVDLCAELPARRAATRRGAPFRCSTSSRPMPRLLRAAAADDRGRPRRTARCSSAARSAIPAAPRRSPPGSVDRAGRRRRRARSRRSRRARPRVGARAGGAWPAIAAGRRPVP